MSHESTQARAAGAGDPPTALDALVARTAGPQWWRKAFHALNAVLIASVIAALEPSRGVAVAGIGILTLAAFAIDGLRLSSPRANELFFRALGKLASPREARGIASSTWYMVGILAVVAVFPREVAISAILVLGLCDPAAAWVGRRLGRRPFLGGTLEGSLAFFVVGVVIMSARHAWPAALAAAAVAALAERRAWPLDDNLAIPIASAAVIHAMEWMG
jgi:dolichol kinase